MSTSIKRAWVVIKLTLWLYFFGTVLLIPAAYAEASGLSIMHDSLNYSGEYTDQESNLQYLKARYYHTALLRFIERDSYKLFNRYTYADGNPITNEDPSGHCIGGSSGGYCSYYGGSSFIEQESAGTDNESEEEISPFSDMIEQFDPTPGMALTTNTINPLPAAPFISSNLTPAQNWAAESNMSDMIEQFAPVHAMRIIPNTIDNFSRAPSAPGILAPTQDWAGEVNGVAVSNSSSDKLSLSDLIDLAAQAPSDKRGLADLIDSRALPTGSPSSSTESLLNSIDWPAHDASLVELLLKI